MVNYQCGGIEVMLHFKDEEKQTQIFYNTRIMIYKGMFYKSKNSILSKK